MKITNQFEQYKEASRHIWNTYFLKEGKATWEDYEIFEEIERLLFERIVLTSLGLNRSTPFDGRFKVTARDGHNCLPIMVNRTSDGGYWDHLVTALIDDNYGMDFLEYFDFDQLSIKDNRYIIAKIIFSQKHPEINGHKAMIESQYADIYYGDAGLL